MKGWLIKSWLYIWLTSSGRFTHISGHPSAEGRACDRESSPAKTDVLPLCHSTNLLSTAKRLPVKTYNVSSGTLSSTLPSLLSDSLVDTSCGPCSDVYYLDHELNRLTGSVAGILIEFMLVCHLLKSAGDIMSVTDTPETGVRFRSQYFISK